MRWSVVVHEQGDGADELTNRRNCAGLFILPGHRTQNISDEHLWPSRFSQSTNRYKYRIDPAWLPARLGQTNVGWGPLMAMVINMVTHFRDQRLDVFSEPIYYLLMYHADRPRLIGWQSSSFRWSYGSRRARAPERRG
ncbi:hypothetical protein EVAR_46123_1 [Eumeta japonica]|uniref:Uncharacterized protein n=1 Tax=Eumeta variegata TaxID=151549 RepID=A0A4C1XTT0_EUMVA|nr:hypothetical protein EVAR_46123_1 [Eumeta japonica]